MANLVILVNITLCCLFTIVFQCAHCAIDEKPIRLSLTISARRNALEVSWFHLRPLNGTILLTDQEPIAPFIHRRTLAPVLIRQRYTNSSQESEDISSSTSSSSEQKTADITLPQNVTTQRPELIEKTVWTFGPDNREVLYSVQPTEDEGWLTTDIHFDTNLLSQINSQTKCYGYWAVYLNEDGEIVATACIRTYATWMNDMKDHIKSFKFRDLFIIGSHDSGSFRSNFNPRHNETLVTKYSLTQNDDITGQLMHGVRYLDIRVGYYRGAEPKFWVNHGISRQQPLSKVLQQVRDFVLETNEIVIFDVQEFPVGFGKKLDIHRQLVFYIQKELGELLADPALTWDTTLDDIWKRRQNIILSYDYIGVVNEFPSILWHSVQQRWGNVQNLADLKRHLSPVSRGFVIFSTRPVADMAELTPTTWDVITDRFGGLRKIADQSNRHISKWYIDELGQSANIVAVDFYRGTNLVETALYWNSRRTGYKRYR